MVQKILPKISKGEEKLLFFLWRFIDQNKFPPSQDEMAIGVGIKSRSFTRQLRSLQGKGYVLRTGGRRGDRITELGIEKLALLGLISNTQMELSAVVDRLGPLEPDNKGGG